MEFYVSLEGDEDSGLNYDDLEEILNGSLRKQHQKIWGAVDEIDSHDTNFLEYSESDPRNTLLTLLGEKRATMPIGGGRTPDISPLSDYAESVQSMGGDVYIKDEVAMRDGREVHMPRVFVTKDRSFREAKIPVFNGNEVEIGRSLGYPEEEVNAFSEHGMWPEGIKFNENNEMVPAEYEPGTEYLFSPDMLAREHGRTESIDDLDLINYTVRDNEESLRNAIERGRRYRNAIEKVEEKYDLNFL